ncbi:hypothetical protein [Clostridium pasteurianum]|uniref:hypothetical protein n=1 Tax=Clostridium pasteurianum TaxID=1501 RepID=UPI000824BED1|nr:hypothetical protein [Clostridium pasteurianum]PJI07209.1 hypothetical protein CUB90_04720 [Clostridium sp. CT7]
MLLPGDCDYDVINMNKYIFPITYLHIVVPHHGSVMVNVLSVLKKIRSWEKHMYVKEKRLETFIVILSW